MGKLEEMLAARKAPGVVTDRWMRGGVYMPPLARFPGDPEATVASRGDVRRVLDRRGWGAEGMVEAKVRTEPKNEPYEPAPDIIERHVALEARQYGDLTPREREQLRQEVRKRLSGNQEMVDGLDVG